MKLIYTSTKSTAKQKKKPGWREAQAEYDLWLKKHGVEKNSRTKKEFIPYVPSKTVVRETPRFPSLNSFTGSTAPVEKKVYTGDKIIGIAAMHKSNLVPVFSSEEAKDVSTMRRG